MKVPKRRRRENKTDYKARLILLKSGLPRIVIRKTNKYIIVQYVESKNAQDKVIITISSKKLIQYGWPEKWQGSLKSIPACYLTGYLAGKKILEKIGKKTVLDIGMLRSIAGSRIYAVLKGIVDVGINIKYKDKIFPKEDRIKGMHIVHIKKNIQEILEKIKNNIKENKIK